MDTSAISYRVADFLKQHPPFQAMAEADLIDLAAQGRVRFYEGQEYVLWQGEPHRQHVFVIQQGTVSLWDEIGERSELRDVRGPGDMLGIERFNGARSCLYTARAATDVVIYAFDAHDFGTLLSKYEYARRFVEAYGTVTADYQWLEDRRTPQRIFLHDVVSEAPTLRVRPQRSIRDVAGIIAATGRDAVVVVDEDDRPRAAVTARSLVQWIASGAGGVDQPIDALLGDPPPVVGPHASVTAGVLAMALADTNTLALTEDGSPSGRLQALVTSRDVARAFGDHPIAILSEIRDAASLGELRALNHRARALALRYLTSAASVDWLAGFMSLVDAAVLKRVIALADGCETTTCWCICGPCGRGESLTRHAPQVLLILADGAARARAAAACERVRELLTECDYLTRIDAAFDGSFYVATAAEWAARYRDWVRDPVRQQAYLARSLFDLRVVAGRRSLWADLDAAVANLVEPEFLGVLANDCFASLPPLTFFQDAVVDESGAQTSVFRLEHSALRPLVDVGRVFGMAARKVFGTSTLDRFALARTLLPEHESIFREASDTLRILLWQQGRIGIGQGTTGSELPPALLSRHDRHVLKSGFRAILRLIEFTTDSPWLATL